MVGFFIILGTVFLILFFFLRKKIINSKAISKLMNPIVLGFLYIFTITIWICIDNPAGSNITETKLQLYQTLIASIGAVCIAIIAYWGATASIRMEKIKENERKFTFDNVLYPSKITLLLLKCEFYTNSSMKSFMEFDENDSSDKYKIPKTELKKTYLVLQDLEKAMDFESLTKYSLFLEFQAYKIFLDEAIIELSSLLNKAKKIVELSNSYGSLEVELDYNHYDNHLME